MEVIGSYVKESLFAMLATGCYGNLQLDMKIQWLLQKSLVAMEVNGCNGKKSIPMEIQWFLWKGSGSYGKSMDAMER
jgi:hypothetical protein